VSRSALLPPSAPAPYVATDLLQVQPIVFSKPQLAADYCLRGRTLPTTSCTQAFAATSPPSPESSTSICQLMVSTRKHSVTYCLFHHPVSCKATCACFCEPSQRCIHLENSSSMIENKLPLPRPGLRPLPSEEETLTGITMLFSETQNFLNLFLYAIILVLCSFPPLCWSPANFLLSPPSHPHRHQKGIKMAYFFYEHVRHELYDVPLLFDYKVLLSKSVRESKQESAG